MIINALRKDEVLLLQNVPPWHASLGRRDRQRLGLQRVSKWGCFLITIGVLLDTVNMYLRTPVSGPLGASL